MPLRPVWLQELLTTVVKCSHSFALVNAAEALATFVRYLELVELLLQALPCSLSCAVKDHHSAFPFLDSPQDSSFLRLSSRNSGSNDLQMLLFRLGELEKLPHEV
ncbi:hypothetical protein D3C72_1629700 [compost metagenome]